MKTKLETQHRRYNSLRLKMTGMLTFTICVLFTAVSFAQTSCTDCTTACGSQGIPCCNVWNACNYNQSFCYSNTGCPGSTVDPDTGCDLACTPIDGGILFLLVFGATGAAFLLVHKRRMELSLQDL